VGLEGGLVIGVIFGALAAVCAYVISYAEYKRNWSFHGNAKLMALRSAAVAFVFFFLAGLLLPLLFGVVVPRG
jgi:hypothetical protein